MSRRVRVIRSGAPAAAAAAPAGFDTYFDKVLKYIPADVLTQTIISTGAFAVWVFALGGPFHRVPGQPVYGPLLLILYTLVAARINPREG
jgi:hypothetical protein